MTGGVSGNTCYVMLMQQVSAGKMDPDRQIHLHVRVAPAVEFRRLIEGRQAGFAYKMEIF